MRRLSVLTLLGGFAALLSIASAAQAATVTVCHSGCTYTTIEPAVAAAGNGDTVEVEEGGTYTQQVTVNNDITLEGDPNGPRPLLTFAPSGGNSPTLKFSTNGSGSTLKHIDVQSNGSYPNDAIDFDQSNGTITDVSATATGTAIYTYASGVTVGPGVAVTGTDVPYSTGLFAGDEPVTVTGLTATVTGTEGEAVDLAAGGVITDSTMTDAAGYALSLVGATARRVVATGAVGIDAEGDSLVTDSVAIGLGSSAVSAGDGTLQLRNVTAISTASGAAALEARAAASGNEGAIVAKNVIARGGSGGTDLLVDQTSPSCGGGSPHPPCVPGTVQIGYSNFTTASPSVDTTTIGHNQSGDPQFVDGTVGPAQDFHLQRGSPAIGAGTSDADTGTTDLDGEPRPAAGETEPSIGAYEPTVHALTISVSGGGSVSGPGISCPATCSQSYVAGTTVALTAAPASGSSFAGWSGACSGVGSCQVTMSSDSSVTAAFTPIAAPASAGLPALSDVHLGSDAFLSRKGTALRLTLSEAATINVSVTQAQSGRIAKGRCKAGAKQGKRCTIAVVKANLTFTGGAGSNLFALLVRSLAPGHYTATITAVADGQSSTPVPLSFTIEKPKPKRR